MFAYKEINTRNLPKTKEYFAIADKTSNMFVAEVLNWSGGREYITFKTTDTIEEATKHWSYSSAVLHMNCYNKNLNHNCSIIKITTKYLEVM